MRVRKLYVLWASRHQPLKSQMEALEDYAAALGLDGVVMRTQGFVGDADRLAEDLNRAAETYAVVAVVPVLPLGIVKRIAEKPNRRYEVLWPVMETVYKGSLEDALLYADRAGRDRHAVSCTRSGVCKVSRFDGFKRLLAVAIITEDLTPPMKKRRAAEAGVARPG